MYCIDDVISALLVNISFFNFTSSLSILTLKYVLADIVSPWPGDLYVNTNLESFAV